MIPFRSVVPAIVVPGCLVLMLSCGGSGGKAGSGSGGSSGGGTVVAGKSVYVSIAPIFFGKPVAGSVLATPEATTGATGALTVLTGPTGLSFSSVTVDAAGKLYVGGQTFATGSTGMDTAEVLVYAAGASGTAKPLTTLVLPGLFNNLLADVEVDPAGNIYVLADVAIGTGAAGRVYAGVSVYTPTVTGYTAGRVLAGPSTTIEGEHQIAVSDAGAIYLTGGSQLGAQSILIFNPGATGDAAPNAEIGGDKTMLFTVEGMALDASGNLYVLSLAEVPPPGALLEGTPSILEFAAGATGNVAPIRIISGSLTGLGNAGPLRVDSAAAIYTFGGSGVVKFAPGASGNVAPSPANLQPTSGTAPTYDAGSASGFAVQ